MHYCICVLRQAHTNAFTYCTEVRRDQLSLHSCMYECAWAQQSSMRSLSHAHTVWYRFLLWRVALMYSHTHTCKSCSLKIAICENCNKKCRRETELIASDAILLFYKKYNKYSVGAIKYFHSNILIFIKILCVCVHFVKKKHWLCIKTIISSEYVCLCVTKNFYFRGNQTQLQWVPK